MKKTKSPAGRKPLPPEQKKKLVRLYIEDETIANFGGIEGIKRFIYLAIEEEQK